MSLNAKYGISELILSFVGVGISGTVYYAREKNIDLPCSTGGGCSLAESSRWSMFHGVPVALIGTAAYAALALLSVVKLNADQGKIVRASRFLMLAMSAFGFLYSWYLQYVGIIYIGVACIYCRSSAITMTLLFFVILAETLLAARSPQSAGVVDSVKALVTEEKA